MEKNKKSMILAIVAVISFIIITVGATLAFFNYAKTGSTENTIETGSISFIYEEVNRIGNGISIEDALPTSDNEGKAQTNYFDFKVTSSSASTIAIPYEITTRVVDGSDDLTDYVKLYLTKVNGNSEEQKVLSIYSDLDDSTNSLASRYNDKTLYEDEIPADSTNFVENYRLRMWLDNSVDLSDESFNNKTFSIKVNVYANGEQANQQKIASATTTDISGIKINGVTATANNDSSLNYDYYVETDLEDGNDIELVTLNDGQTYTVENITEQEANTLRQVVSKKDLNLVSGTNYLKITVTSANRKNTEVYVVKVLVLSPETVWEFEFDPDGNGKGQVQEFTVPRTGTYKLEVWGAQGGSFDETYYGGHGGYSTGTISLNKDNTPTLYVVVGGAGAYSSKDVSGGYNGGGNSYGYDRRTASGGGATHIATATGVLSSLASNQNSVLIVAGGGGAAYNENNSNNGYGGAGGGTTGAASPNAISGRNYKTPATAGTQSTGGTYGVYYNSSYNGLGESSNGSFGQGGSYQSGGADTRICGGGGGFYGGGATYQGAAAGGSGYIGGVTNGQTLDGDSLVPTYDGTSTMTGNTGNGYAKITYVGN